MRRLLELIARLESGNDANAVWSGIRAEDQPFAVAPSAVRDGEGRTRVEDRRYMQLTSMTVSQVLAWQDEIDRFYPSEAAGKYQILEDTLREFAGRILNKAFDAQMQDHIALKLIRRRGLSKVSSGALSVEAFCNNLAKEWASLPVVTDCEGQEGWVAAGQSYYAGDTLNKSHCTPREVLAAVRADLADMGVKLAAPPQEPEATFYDRKTITAAQEQLKKLGYEVGTVDGIMGPATQRAIAGFERDNYLEADGQLDDVMLGKLAKAGSKPVSTQRKSATFKQLKGSGTLKIAAGQTIAGGSVGGLGLLSIAEPYIPTSFYGLSEMARFVSEHTKFLVVVGSVVVIGLGIVLAWKRLKDHRTGRNMTR